jgi:hypothetical protein
MANPHPSTVRRIFGEGHTIAPTAKGSAERHTRFQSRLALVDFPHGPGQRHGRQSRPRHVLVRQREGFSNRMVDTAVAMGRLI